WLIGLVVLGGLAYYFLGQKLRAPSVPTTTAIMHNGVNISGQLNTAIDGFKTTLGSIKDEATARAAVPGLQTAAKGIETVAD
ncbi:MAG TPA: hypothetical protein PK264_17600, partial [Hyphomicrobiaceae bacterium]|nr:hypothetical protein [Hyphomicrobiaceae bacterium]